MSHHITTHPKGILAEVAGMAEICGSGSLTFAAVRLHIQNSKNTVTAPSASHAVKNNRRRCISITCFLQNLEEEYRERVSSPLRDCKNPVNWGLAALLGLATVSAYAFLAVHVLYITPALLHHLRDFCGMQRQ
jgi:hypothetical protein